MTTSVHSKVHSSRGAKVDLIPTLKGLGPKNGMVAGHRPVRGLAHSPRRALRHGENCLSNQAIHCKVLVAVGPFKFLSLVRRGIHSPLVGMHLVRRSRRMFRVVSRTPEGKTAWESRQRGSEDGEKLFLASV